MGCVITAILAWELVGRFLPVPGTFRLLAVAIITIAVTG